MNRISLVAFAIETLTQSFEDALNSASSAGYRIDKCADDMDGAAEGLTVEEASAIADEDPNLITLCRSVAPRFTPGDRVRTVDTRSDDADAGIFHGMTDDGKASVGWDSGTRSPIPLAMIEPE